MNIVNEVEELMERGGASKSKPNKILKDDLLPKLIDIQLILLKLNFKSICSL